MTEKARKLTVPRLNSLDDLYLLDNPHGDNGSSDNTGSALQTLDISQLTPFVTHPFRLYQGERLEDMVQSIKNNGVIVPIIVRRQEDVFEILSGHNRVNASKLAGIATVPALVKESLSDEDAMRYVIETNLMQRSFNDMAHSEKAAVISLHHSKLFSQGKRNDIIEELRQLESRCTPTGGSAYAQNEHRMKSRDIVAQEYGLNRNTVARYLRIDKLITELKVRLDNKEIPFIAAVTLSFLDDGCQHLLNHCLELNSFKMDQSKAEMLREYSEKGELDSDSIYLILSGGLSQNIKPQRTPTVKVSKAIYSKYFRPEQSASEVQDIVEKALDLYFSGQ